jgi:hypothetical protein
MNLRAMTGGLIGAINPKIAATWQASTGYTKSTDYKQVASYGPAQSVMVQMQALSSPELKQMNDLNISGVLRALYVDGVVKGASRAEQTGGDKFTINGEVWLCVQVLESWPDWTKVVICLQQPGT